MTTDMNKVWGLSEEVGVLGEGGQRGKNWDNWKNIINKIEF